MTQTASDPWSPLDNLLVEGLHQGVYTAAAALVGLKGELLWEGCAGRVSSDPEADAVTPETIFDLASLTKPLATALCVLFLVREGKLALDASLGEVLPGAWLPEDKRPLTIRRLLTHRSGLAAWRPFYQEILTAPTWERPRLLPRLAAATPLDHPPDTVTLYSDLGFMLLQAAVEKVSGRPLDHYCRERVYRPLGLSSLGFIRLNLKDNLKIHENLNRRDKPWSSPSPLRGEGRGGGENSTLSSPGDNLKNREIHSHHSYAATEPGLIPERSISGEVHDENAWAAGGVAGHAGLFGQGFEVFRLLATLYRAYHGEPIKYLQPFPPELVRRFLTAVPGGRALGFDITSPDAAQCSAGRYFSPMSVGHLGFTGTSFWLDLELGQVVILLTNRVHLGRDDKTKIQAFRPRFHEAASRALGFSKSFRV